MATFGTFTAGQILTAAELNSAGVWDSYTPTFTQSATIAKTVNWARYVKLGKWVQVSIKLTSSGAGTANNLILIGLPVAASANNYVMGQMIRWGSTDTQNRLHYVIYQSSTTVKFTLDTSDSLGDADFHGQTAGDGVTVASGDTYFLNVQYEAS